MVSNEDIGKAFALLGIIGLLLYGVFAIAIPGTSNDTTTQKYVVDTRIDACASALGEGSLSNFDYETREQRITDLPFSMINAPLAIGGVNNAEVELEVRNSAGTKILDSTKVLGEIGAGQCETVRHEFKNIESGEYNLNYVYRYQPEVFGFTQSKTFETSVTVPEP